MQIAGLVRTAPERAVSLYETFLAGCYEKAEEIDDSSGSFSQFVGQLFCGWINARQTVGADAGETATRLLAWMDDDPYGVLLPPGAGHGEGPRQGRTYRIRAADPRASRRCCDREASSGAPFRRNPDYQRRRCSEILRAIYLRQKNVDAYVALTEVTELTAQDCQAQAMILVARRNSKEALSWVERGLALDKKDPHGFMASDDLAHLKRKLLAKALGRGDEALEAAWAGYRAHPSSPYADLMKYVPQPQRAAWHEKALEAATGADLHSLIELLLDIKELERLADLVHRTQDTALEGVSHYATEPAAKKLDKTHPELAARLWFAQGMRVVKAKKSKYSKTKEREQGTRRIPLTMRETQRCAQRELLSVLRLVDAGKVAVSDKTRRASATTIDAITAVSRMATAIRSSRPRTSGTTRTRAPCARSHGRCSSRRAA